MARNSKRRSNQKPKSNKKNASVGSNRKNKKEISKLDVENSSMQEEPISPRTAMENIMEGDKPNHSLGEWMNEIGKHPISRLSKDDSTVAITQEVDNLEKECIQITSEDVQPEIDFWQSSVVAFVIGAAPPVQVMEGFIRRIWKQYGVDKVINLPKGMYLIRLNTMENREKILQNERPFFDSKPMILKPWVEDMDFMQDEIKKIPIWMQVSVDFKYWGIRSLEKILKPVGDLLRLDAVTTKRERLQYARCMVEVKFNQDFPDHVEFKDEKGNRRRALLHYEWKPILCSSCHKVGHSQQECYHKKETKQGQKQWVRKVSENTQGKEKENVDESRRVEVPQEKIITRTTPSATTASGDEKDLTRSSQNKESNGSNQAQVIVPEGGNKVQRSNLPYGGNYYTWCNKQEAEHRVYSKLDRVMGNDSWLEAYPKANALFLPENISDHSPALLRGDSCTGGGHKPFKYFRMWSNAVDFNARIADAWRWSGSGTNMYCLIKKLKKVKCTLMELNRSGFCELQAGVTKALMQLTEAQTELQLKPLDNNLIMAERAAAKEYQERNKVYMQFLRQKAKCSWIKEGDENTALFHQSIKQRRLQNNIYAIKNAQGMFVEDQVKVASAFVEYYQSLLGQQQQQRERCDLEIIKAGPILDEDQRKNLVKQFTKEEVKVAMFSIKGDKAPGPDGFGAYFYQDNWDLVGEDVCKAVLDFFEYGKLLKEVNCTFLSMIPKVNNPMDVSEFRPIACCNTIYKCITKMLCFRLKEVLPKLIAINQGAFVHGRYIIHNIMVCQDLVRKYGRANTSPSCMMKVDLRKAYDTVEWRFIEEMMEGLGFPKKFTDWVMECVTTPMFSVVINGSPHGFFKSARGLRQGDPISPLLFVMGMEYLSRSLTKVAEEQGFHFHPRCRAAKLTHLCFADDLILCCKGEQASIDKLLRGFNHFSQVSGLQANRSKTEIYTCGMKDQEVQNVLNESGFKRGALPFSQD
ncbi:LINE-1 retrotransposable element ORF2 protein [Bienertia sinuspersici]